MKKKIYTQPEASVVKFGNTSVISCSDGYNSPQLYQGEYSTGDEEDVL